VLALAAVAGSEALAQTQYITTVEDLGGSPYSVTSDGAGNVFFPFSGSVCEAPAQTQTLYCPTVGGEPTSQVTYPFANPIVAVTSDVSGDVFVAVQYPLNSPTSGPYVNVYEMQNQPILLTGSTTLGSYYVNVSSTAGLAVGQLITGPGIPAGTEINVVNTGQIGLSQEATVTGSGVTLQVPVYTWTGSVLFGPTTPPPLGGGGPYSTLNSMAYDNLNAFLYVNYFNGVDGQQSVTCANIPINFTGNTTSGSTTVTVSSTSGLFKGQVINSAGPDIPNGDTIASVGYGTITMTVAATGTTSSFGTAMNLVPGYGCDSITEFSAPLNDRYPNGLAVDGAGNVYTMFMNGTGGIAIAQFPAGFSSNGTIYSSALTATENQGLTSTQIGVLNNLGTAAIIGDQGSIVAGLAADNAGQIFIDAGSEIFIYVPSLTSGSPTGVFSSVAGTGTNGYNLNGAPTGLANSSEINYSEGVGLDPSGDLWVADTGNGFIREIVGVGIGQGEGTGSVSGVSTFGCLECGPQTLSLTDTIQTNHFSNATVLDPSTHKLYVAYPTGLVVFDTANDTVQTTTTGTGAGMSTAVDFIAQDITQMVLDQATNIIWAINSAGQVLAINSVNDQVVGSLSLVTGAFAQAIAVDSTLDQVYVAYYVKSGISESNHVAVVSGAFGNTLISLSLSGSAQALVADSAHGVAYAVAQDPYSACPSCPQYDYDLVAINGTTANGNKPIEITSTTTLIEGSAYSSGITESSLAVDPHTGKVVLADAVDAYMSLYNPAVPSYEAVDRVSLGWIPNAVTIDTDNSLAYITDSQYNNVQVYGLAAVLANTAYAFEQTLASGTQGGNSCGLLSNAVVPDSTTGEAYVTTCTVNSVAETASPQLSLWQYGGYTISGTTLTPSFTQTASYALNAGNQTFGFYSYEYALNVDTSDHALFLGNGPNQNILVFNGPAPGVRPQETLTSSTSGPPFTPITSLAFGSDGLYQLQPPQDVDYFNLGNGFMLDPVITFSGSNAADFTKYDDCNTGLNPSSPPTYISCYDAVDFSPSVLGNESATATIVDNSPDLPQTIALTGTGVLPVGVGGTAGSTSSSTLLQVSTLEYNTTTAPPTPLTLYATISPAIPSSSTEEILFLNNATSPATVLGTGTRIGTSSVWSLSLSSPAAGTYTVTAYFAGDATYAPSTSSVVTVTVASSFSTAASQPLFSFTPGEFYQAQSGETCTSCSNISLDSAGDEFFLGSGDAEVTKYPIGGSSAIFVEPDPYDQGSQIKAAGGVGGLAVSPSGGTVYLTDNEYSRITTAASAGTSFLSPLELFSLGACASGGTPTGFLNVANPTGISIGPPATTTNASSPVVPNIAGYDLYVANSGGDNVLQINPVGGSSAQCGYYVGGAEDAVLAGYAGTVSGTAIEVGPTLNKPLSVAASGTLSNTKVYIADAPPAITNTTQGNGTIYQASVRNITGSLNGTTTVSSVSSTAGLATGQIVSGTGIPLGDTIAAVGTGTIMLATAATASKTGVALQSETIPTAIANTGQIVFPYSVATDAAGDVYYSDESLDQVWRIDTLGNFLLVAGNGVNSTAAASTCTSTSPCEATQTDILTPYGLAVSSNGSIFIGDAVHNGELVGEVNVTAGMLSFPSQPAFSTSSALTVTVTNTASMPLGATPGVPIITGTGAADFAISGGTCNAASGFTLTSGQSCTILVTFSPQTTGPFTAQINLSTQSETFGGTQQTILLTGTGTTGLTPQTINFPPPPRPMVYGAGSIALSASASSGLTVSFSVLAGPGLLSGGNNNILSFTGAGLVRIQASQGGNGTYAAAASVEQDIPVVPATLAVTALPTTRIYDGADPPFTVSVTGLVGTDTLGIIGFTGSPVFTVASDLGTTPAGTNLTVNAGVGTLSLTSPNYILSLVPSTLGVVCCEPQTLLSASTLPTNFPLAIGVPLSLSGGASSGLPVTFTVVSGPGTIGTNPLGGGTVTATGPGTITVQVTQAGNGNIGAASPYNITINSNLTITTPTGALPVGTVGVPYTALIAAGGGLKPYSWSATGLAAGLSINSSTGLISATSPGPTTAGTYPIVVKVEDRSGNTASAPFSITVNSAPLTITTGTLPVGLVNLPYPATTFMASGGAGAYSWSVSGLPPGVTTDGAGDISGTPTVAGPPSTITVKVTDSVGETVTKYFTLFVAPSPLTINPSTTFPAGTLNTAYTPTTFTASGGVGVYTWTASGLPPGLYINLLTGVVSGTPTADAGSPYTVTIFVTDQTGTTAPNPFPLTIFP
jgi:hypothetical protein